MADHQNQKSSNQGKGGDGIRRQRQSESFHAGDPDTQRPQDIRKQHQDKR